jgi:hypothetical protein
MLPQAPTGALAGTGRLYTKTVSGIVQLFYMTSAGVELQLTPGTSAAGIFAAVNFDGRGPVVIRSQTNVSGVTRTASGRYTVNFTVASANPPNYIVQITGQRDSSTNTRQVGGFVIASSSYGTSQTINKVDIGFKGGSDDFEDVLMGNVLIYQV